MSGMHSSIHTKDQLVEFALTKLGKPVIEINVDPVQINACLEQTFETWWHFHPDGLQKVYLKHKITQTDIDNKWIPIDDNVYGITKVFPYKGITSTNSNNMLFDLQYQIMMNSIFDLSNVQLAQYEQTMTHVSLIQEILNGKPLFRFNRLMNRLYLDCNWGSEVKIDDYVLVEAYVTVDPDVYTRVYSEPWIKKYLTACIKQQWGANMKKYQGMQLMGGVTVDGQSMYDEATQEMNDLEEEIIQNGAPLEFFVG